MRNLSYTYVLKDIVIIYLCPEAESGEDLFPLPAKGIIPLQDTPGMEWGNNGNTTNKVLIKSEAGELNQRLWVVAVVAMKAELVALLDQDILFES